MNKRIIVIIFGLALFLGACTIVPANSVITEDKAIRIASPYVPPEAVARSSIMAIFRAQSQTEPSYWQIQFLRADVTRDELEELGWEEGENTIFKIWSNGPLSPEGIYLNVIISMDAKTGDIIRKYAGNSVLLGPIGSDP